jgi:hypothetical protein
MDQSARAWSIVIRRLGIDSGEQRVPYRRRTDSEPQIR